DSHPCALFSAQNNFVLFDQLADIFEADRRFMDWNMIEAGDRIYQMRCGNAFADAAMPALLRRPGARFHQVVQQKRQDIIGLNECAAFIEDTKTVSIAVSGQSEMRAV